MVGGVRVCVGGGRCAGGGCCEGNDMSLRDIAHTT